MVTLSSMPEPALVTNDLTITATITMDLPPVVPSGIRWYFLADIGPTGSGDSDDLMSDDVGVEIMAGDGISFSEDRRTLTISSLTYQNEGWYTVRVTNEYEGDMVGTDSDSIFIDVQGEEGEGERQGRRERKREGGEGEG